MIYIGIFIAVIMAALGGFGWVEKERANIAVHRADAAELKLDSAQKRATALALLWSAQVDKTEAEVTRQREQDHAEIAALELRVAGLSTRPALHYSDDAWQLWIDAIGAATDPAIAPEVVAGRTPAVSDHSISEQQDIGWKVDAAAAYRSALLLFHECREFYQNLREQGK